MHGLGVYTWKIGDKYIGEVHFGRIHGFGTYTWRTNSKCALSHPRFSAHTLAVLPAAPWLPKRHACAAIPALRYVGQWKDGKMHGSGVKTDPQGATFHLCSRCPLLPRLIAHCATSTRPRRAHRRAHPSGRGLLTAARPFPFAGNLFEGEWREGKPVMKDGKRLENPDGGPMDWLTEAVSNVSVNIGGGPSRGGYGRVSTHDDDER